MCRNSDTVGSNSKMIMESLERVDGQGGIMNRVSEHVAGKGSERGGLRIWQDGQGDEQPENIKEKIEEILDSLRSGVSIGLMQFYEDQLVQKYVLQVIEAIQTKLRINTGAKLQDIHGLMDDIQLLITNIHLVFSYFLDKAKARDDLENASAYCRKLIFPLKRLLKRGTPTEKPQLNIQPKLESIMYCLVMPYFLISTQSQKQSDFSSILRIIDLNKNVSQLIKKTVPSDQLTCLEA